MFKVLRYKVGTMINCDCKTGFRRVSVVMRCAGNSSHSAWENRCLCNSISPAKNPVKQVTPGPKEQNERKPTDVQSQTQPPEQADLPDDIEPWESTEAPPGSGPFLTTRTAGTTDFQKPTEEVATLDTFIFTTEYQIAGITCPTPTSVEHADIRVKNYSINSRERYVCNSGFKRKAGTSSLTQCVFNETAKVAHWTTPNLKCIRDPSLSHQRPPSTAAPTGLTPEPESPTPSGKGAYQYNPRVVTGEYSPWSFLCLLVQRGHQQLPLSLSEGSPCRWVT
ncbi:hypothetical protein G4228_015234 [Cervus hanglu yarkandensis]|nr:hypothetical protein G4228_015234 [Cervus hanglu yarkandensis]